MVTNSPLSTPPRPGIDAFHRERSRCLDAFVAAEEAIIALLERSATRFGGEPFGSKIESLRKAKVSARYSAVHKARVNGLLDELKVLAELRNDLVHARLQMAIIGEDQKACFINARQSIVGAQSARLLSLEGLREVTRKTSRIAEELQSG